MGAIQPEILTWARETAGLSLDDAARAVGLKKAYGETGAERLAKLEDGQAEPARPLLEKMAKAYRRPLLVFYLGAPPKKGDRGQDFRTLPGGEQDNPELDALIRDIKGRQGLVRSILEDEEAEPIDFVGTATMDVPAKALAVQIAKKFEIDLKRYRAEKTVDAAFSYLRAKVEEGGVFVLLLGNLGSHHTNIPVEIFRGFAIADKLAPMIVINNQDTKSAWPFTAMHEVAHLWLGTTGISGTDTTDKIEQYCNDVAGEILLPTEELKALSNISSFETAVKDITAFADQWRVSRSMVAFKLYRTGKINHALWSRLGKKFHDDFLAFKQKESEKKKASDTGPDYYVVRRHRIGTALLGLVRRALDDGNLTYTKASRVLGVKPGNVEPLLATGANRGLR
jgi:Zn-dependent peptidase ImmA (M78 family)